MTCVKSNARERSYTRRVLWNERTTALSLAPAFEKIFPLSFGGGVHGADVRHLLTSKRHSAVAHHHRMAVLTARSRVFCAFLSFVTIALIPVDAILLPFAAWTTLAIGRVAASAAEGALSVWHPRSACIERHAYIFLGAIMSVVMLWEAFSCAALIWLGADSVPASAFVTYFYEPFVVALGLAIFPLTIAEAMLLLLPVILGMAVNTLNWPLELGSISPPAILLRLFVIGMVGAAASAIQLDRKSTRLNSSH